MPQVSRRAFLQSATAFAVVPASVFAKPAPSDVLTLGLIGLGSMGLRHVKGFLLEKDCRITHTCDVDSTRVKVAADLVDQTYGTTGCKRTGEFGDLLADPGLDTLCIAVPDHWHGALAVAALRAGKDVYGEKPLALTIAEGQAIVRAVRRHGRVWETGSWQRSTAHFRHACELVRNGRVGRLQRVEVGIGIGPTLAPQPILPVPKTLDYERWLGPAPWAPYTEKRVHWNFRWILDYSGGQVTDWGAHHIDIAQWGMGTDDTGPVSVEGTGVFPASGLYDAATHYHFTCAYANGVTLVVGSNDKVRQGVRFVGDRGGVHVTRSGTTTEPAGLVRDTIGPNEIHLAKPHGDHRQGHRRDFLDCVRSRAETITPVEVGHRSITIAHLGNIAMRLGRKVRWDPQTERIVGDAEAARMTARPLRGPWRT